MFSLVNGAPTYGHLCWSVKGRGEAHPPPTHTTAGKVAAAGGGGRIIISICWTTSQKEGEEWKGKEAGLAGQWVHGTNGYGRRRGLNEEGAQYCDSPLFFFVCGEKTTFHCSFLTKKKIPRGLGPFFPPPWALFPSLSHISSAGQLLPICPHPLTLPSLFPGK